MKKTIAVAVVILIVAPLALRGQQRQHKVRDPRQIEVQMFVEEADRFYDKALELQKELDAELASAKPSKEKINSILDRARALRGELDQFTARKKYYLERWLTWLNFEDWSEGLPGKNLDPSFGNPLCIPAVGDVNSDGLPDIAALGDGGKGPKVWLNKGGGKWVESSGGLPNLDGARGGGARFADVDGDGHVDLVIGATGIGLLIYLGDGKGNWKPYDKPLPAETDKGRWLDVEIGDVNGDAKPDIVLVGEGKNGILILYSDGEGGWKAKSGEFPTDDGFVARVVHLADVNNDKRPDILAASSDGIVWLNGGQDGWKRSDPPVKLPKGDAPQDAAVADFNGDGNVDIVVASPGGALNDAVDAPYLCVNVFLGDGKGGWRESSEGIERPDIVPTTEGKRPRGAAVAVVDFNLDSNPDILDVEYGGRFVVYLGDGAGKWTKAKHGGIPAPSEGETIIPYGLVASDIDGDGLTDLILACPSSDFVSVGFPRRTTLPEFLVWRNASRGGVMRLHLRRAQQALDKILARPPANP